MGGPHPELHHTDTGCRQQAPRFQVNIAQGMGGQSGNTLPVYPGTLLSRYAS